MSVGWTKVPKKDQKMKKCCRFFFSSLFWNFGRALKSSNIMKTTFNCSSLSLKRSLQDIFIGNTILWAIWSCGLLRGTVYAYKADLVTSNKVRELRGWSLWLRCIRSNMSAQLAPSLQSAGTPRWTRYGLYFENAFFRRQRTGEVYYNTSKEMGRNTENKYHEVKFQFHCI